MQERPVVFPTPVSSSKIKFLAVAEKQGIFHVREGRHGLLKRTITPPIVPRVDVIPILIFPDPDMEVVRTDKITYYVYNGISDQILHNRKMPDDKLSSCLKRLSHKWTGRAFDDWEHAWEQALLPWKEGQTQLLECLERLEQEDLPEPRSRKRQTRYREDVGDEVDLDRLRAGQPYWRSSQREVRKGPHTIPIIIDTAAAANVKSRKIFWKGCAALALAHKLEAAGFRTELYTCAIAPYCAYEKSQGHKFGMFTDTKGMASVVRLKGAADPIDMTGMINIVAGWYFRTVGLRSIETFAHEHDLLCVDGLGPPGTVTPKHVETFLKGKEDMIISAGIWSFEGAVEFAAAELKKRK